MYLECILSWMYLGCILNVSYVSSIYLRISLSSIYLQIFSIYLQIFSMYLQNSWLFLWCIFDVSSKLIATLNRYLQCIFLGIFNENISSDNTRLLKDTSDKKGITWATAPLDLKIPEDTRKTHSRYLRWDTSGKHDCIRFQRENKTGIAKILCLERKANRLQLVQMLPFQCALHFCPIGVIVKCHECSTKTMLFSIQNSDDKWVKTAVWRDGVKKI